MKNALICGLLVFLPFYMAGFYITMEIATSPPGLFLRGAMAFGFADLMSKFAQTFLEVYDARR
jgi:hypothetical protein